MPASQSERASRTSGGDQSSAAFQAGYTAGVVFMDTLAALVRGCTPPELVVAGRSRGGLPDPRAVEVVEVATLDEAMARSAAWQDVAIVHAPLGASELVVMVPDLDPGVPDERYIDTT